MAQIATINPLNQFFALNGSPLNNGKLYFGEINQDPEQYPVQMYWDSAGLVPALQPIRTTSGYPSRSGSPAILYCAEEYSLRVCQSNDVQVFYLARAGSASLQTFGQWAPSNVTPSYVSANSFTLTGDQTADFQVGRRARFAVTAGAVYGTISASVYGALTTITMIMDGASVLDAGLSSVDLSILTPVNDALPRGVFPTYSEIAGHLYGMNLSTAGSSTTMTTAAGVCTASTGAAAISLAAAIAKTTANWSVGSAAGGKSLAAAIANNTWYHFYAIRRSDTGVTDVCFSTSASGLVAADYVAGGGNVPDAYTQYRRIGSWRTNGSAQWESVLQDGDYFQWLTPPLDVNATNPGTSAVTRTLSVPTGINVLAEMNANLVINTASAGVLLSDLATVDAVPSFSAAPLATFFSPVTSSGIGVKCTVRTNTSAQIRSRLSASDASSILRIATTGWFDTRGRNA
jgi:hypothetical protein